MTNAYSTLIPGPFILLLLLPSIPLLLFSIGARPPDTSALPFSMTEVFTTAAFVSIAGGVVLGLVVWPEMGKNVGGWISGRNTEAGASRTLGSGGSVTWWERVKGGSKRTEMAQYSGKGGQGQYQRTQGVGRVVKAAGLPKSQAGRAAAHLYAIRSRFIQLYNPSRPHAPTALGIVVLLLAVLVVVAGNFIRKLYELDAAPPSSRSVSSGRSSSGGGKDGGDMTPWVMAEIKKRQSEAKAGKSTEVTLARYTKEAEAERKQMKGKVEQMPSDKAKEYRSRKEKERAKELAILLPQLKKLRLTTVGVEGADKINAKAEGASKGGTSPRKEKGGGNGAGASDEGQGGKLGAAKDKWSTWYKKAKSGASGEKKERTSASLGERLKRMILPVPSSQAGSGMAEQMAMMDAALAKNGRGSAMPDKGPGWEVANDPQAEAALAQSASNAEGLAARMKSGS